MERLIREEIPTVVEAEGVDFRSQEVGEMSIAWVRLAAGTDLRPALVGLDDDLCQCPHWGYMLSGQLRMHTRERQHVYTAGDAFYWAAGHAPEAITDCEYVDFSPTESIKTVLDHITGTGG
uniref:Cupin domain-containing protein n=2 Tax=unclassified Mycobacterium TaxID=2642494 RepID=A0A5Q5BRV5_MYCSS